jgi:uncharacterized protein (DUF433 family)
VGLIFCAEFSLPRQCALGALSLTPQPLHTVLLTGTTIAKRIRGHKTRNTTMSALSRIDINPKVMLGKPVIRGTRITVELILRKLAEGATLADLMQAYPHLVKEDIQAAIAYAADMVAHEETVLVEPRG